MPALIGRRHDAAFASAESDVVHETCPHGDADRERSSPPAACRPRAQLVRNVGRNCPAAEVTVNAQSVTASSQPGCGD
jgi:hypothetical protein